MRKMPLKYYLFFTLPTLIAFSIAFFIPFLLGIYLSFTEFTTVTNSQWVGVSNYIHAFTDNRNFLNATIFTVKFAIVSVVVINVLAFALALLLTRKIRGTNVFRTVFFMPNLIGGIILGYIWLLIINGVLINFAVDITFSATYGFWGLIIVTNWQMIGYMMIIYVAGILGISPELYEAAKIDSANSWQTLRHITLPLVMPAITICTFLTLANSFKLFDQNLALTAGAPARASSMMALDIFNTFYGSIATPPPRAGERTAPAGGGHGPMHLIPDEAVHVQCRAQPHLAHTTSSLVFITGPSRTADIEMILTRGVHGPRHLHIVLLPAAP